MTKLRQSMRAAGYQILPAPGQVDTYDIYLIATGELIAVVSEKQAWQMLAGQEDTIR